MKSPLIITALTATMLAMPAMAVSSSANEFKMKVSFDRSALDEDASVASEYQRIQTQVSERCDVENEGYNPLRKILAVRNCVNVTMENTVREIDHAGLTAYHRDQKSS